MIPNYRVSNVDHTKYVSSAAAQSAPRMASSAPKRQVAAPGRRRLFVARTPIDPPTRASCVANASHGDEYVGQVVVGSSRGGGGPAGVARVESAYAVALIER
jgi:hypothetical protein